MPERLILERKLWDSYGDLHVRHPKPTSEAKVDFCLQNSGSIIRNSKEKPDTAIIIPAYNEEGYLARTLAGINLALEDQSYTSVIVVDNNSSDATSDIANFFGASVVHESKKGVARARQTGLESVSDSVKYILTTDADSIVSRNWVGTHKKTLDQKNAVFSYGAIKFISDDNLNLFSSLFFQGYTLSASLFHLINNCRGNIVCGGANSAYLKEIAILCGGYNKDFFVAEDTDIMKRVIQYGEAHKSKNTVITSARRIIKDGVVRHSIERLRNNLNRFVNRNYDDPNSDRSDYR